MNPLKTLRDMRAISSLLTDAERRARAMGEEQPGAEHLLLAALDLPDGSARRAFARLGVDPDRLEAALANQDVEVLVAIGVDPRHAERLRQPAPLAPPTGSGVYRSTASAQEAFQAAGALARSQKAPFVGAHVVAAAAGMEHGTVPRLLAAIGVERSALAAAARDELAGARRST